MLRENLGHLLSSSSFFCLELLSARRECNFRVLSRARTESCSVPSSSLFPELSAPRGRKARIRQHLYQQSELLGYPAYSTSSVELLLLCRLFQGNPINPTANQIPASGKTWEKRVRSVSKERERVYLSVGWTVGQCWGGSRWGTMANVRGPPKVSLLNGASEYRRKIVSDTLLPARNPETPVPPVGPRLRFPSRGRDEGHPSS